MITPILQRLQEKIQAAAVTIASLKKERERLEVDVSLMREESVRCRKVLSEHKRLLAERDRMRTRLERLIKKLDGLKV